MRYYIAAPFFNQTQLQRVIEVENLLTIMQVEFFTPRLYGVIKDMSEADRLKNMRGIYDMNIMMLHRCDGMIALVDDKDTGTIFELGYAVAIKLKGDRKIITLSFENKPVNVMLAFGIDTHCKGIDELQTHLINGQTQMAEVNE